MVTNNAVNISSAGLVKYDGAGTMSAVTTTQYGVLTGGASNGISSNLLTNGQLLIGSTGVAPAAATLTQGTGISITNAAGSITLNAVGGGKTWTVVTGTSQSAVANYGYFANNAGTVTVTLPATAAVGDAFSVCGMNNATGWKLAVGTGQTIYFGSAATTISTGYLQSTATYDNVHVVCNVANTSFVVVNSVGNITVV
jgi:hypothetical protein